MLKSPLNYAGGKYRLLPQLLPLFPKKVRRFRDIFCGGANVAVNVGNMAECVLASDINHHVISLFQYIKKTGFLQVDREIEKIISIYGLSNSREYGYSFYGCNSSTGLSAFNKVAFSQIREDYNTGNHNFSKDTMFFVLLIFGFNNQIRFNSSGRFNMPSGKRDYNSRIRQNFEQFSHALMNEKLQFNEADFDSGLELNSDDFVYADPPYLISTATYNEQDGWNCEDEKRLLHYLSFVKNSGAKFALSNVIEHKGKKNVILEDWIKENNYIVHALNFNYNNSTYHKTEKTITKEILVTSY